MKRYFALAKLLIPTLRAPSHTNATSPDQSLTLHRTESHTIGTGPKEMLLAEATSKLGDNFYIREKQRVVDAEASGIDVLVFNTDALTAEQQDHHRNRNEKGARLPRLETMDRCKG